MRNLKSQLLTKLMTDHNKTEFGLKRKDQEQQLKKMYETDQNWQQKIKIALDEENSLLKEKKKRNQMMLKDHYLDVMNQKLDTKGLLFRQ